MPDGSLRIKTKIDNTGIDKDIINLENKIKKLQTDNLIYNKQENILQGQINSYEELCYKADEYRNKIKQLKSEIKYYENNSIPANQYSNYQESKDKLINTQKEYDNIVRQVDKQALKLDNVYIKLDKIKSKQVENNNKIKEYNQKINDVQKKQLNLNYNTEGIGKSLNKGITKILKYAMALFSIRSIYSLLSNAMNSWLNGNTKGAKQLKSDIDYMKNAIGGALSPILKYIVNLLYQALGFTGALIKAFTGVDIFAGSVADYMQSTTSSANKTNKELKKQLTNFDRINKLNDSSSTGSGNGGGITAPSQDLSNIMEKYAEQAEKIKGAFGKIKDYALDIGLAIAAWELGKILGLTGMQKVGLVIGVVSLKYYLQGIKGIMNGELTAENFMKAFGGAAGLGVSAGMLTGNWKIGLIIGIGSMAFAGGLTIGEKIKEYCPNSIDWYINVVNLDWDHDSVADKIWKSIVIILGTIGDAIVKFLKESIKNIIESLYGFILKKVTIKLYEFQLWLLDKLSGIATWLRGFGALGEALADGMDKGLNSKKDEINKKLTDVIDGTVKVNGDIADKDGKIIGNIYGYSIKGALGDSEGSITNTLKDTVNSVTNKVRNTAEGNGKEIGNKQINGIELGTKSKMNNLRNTTSNVVRNANDRVDTSSSRNIGSNIVSGINSGVNNNSWSLMSTMTNLGTKLLNKFKGALGIHSPSREMASLSKFIPLGIAEGIDSTSDKAIGSMKNLVYGIEDTMNNIDYSTITDIPKIPKNAISYVPHQAISTKEVQRSIIGEDNNLLNKILSIVQENSKSKTSITIPFTIDGEEWFRKTIELNKNYNLATNGGGL